MCSALKSEMCHTEQTPAAIGMKRPVATVGDAELGRMCESVC